MFETNIGGKTYYIRDDMVHSIRLYVEEGLEPGHFLTAVICNNFKEAVGRADPENLENLPAYACYMHWEVPSTCQGSPEKMRDWMASKREKHETLD